ncbi:Uncharacterised protein [Brucella neotomae]|nr:Uncharacterised protein [Brucella neotomae]
MAQGGIVDDPGNGYPVRISTERDIVAGRACKNMRLLADPAHSLAKSNSRARLQKRVANGDFARLRRGKPRNQRQQRGFAITAWRQQRDMLASSNIETEPLQHDGAAGIAKTDIA